MSQKQKILFSILILFLANILAEAIFAQTTTLEVVYPEIFGEAPKAGTGLPEYIAYIYKFAIGIIGLIIFAALIYNGIQYLISAGNPTKMTEAKEGILASFLGAIILLSAWLIFDLINPHLKILTPPPITEISGTIPSGVYICNHKVSDIESILKEYISTVEKNDAKEINKAVEKWVKAVSPRGTDNYCTLARSGKPRFSEISTMFVVPEVKYDPVSKKPFFEYNSAIITKHKSWPTTETRCAIFPEPKNNKIFRFEAQTSGPDISILPGDPGFSVSEIFHIRKLTDVGPGGVILYQGRARNTLGKYEGEEFIPPADLKKRDYRPDEVMEVSKNELKAAELYEKTLSIEVSPPNSFVALLEGRSTLGKTLCEVIYDIENNLTTRPIGQCGIKCMIYSALKNERSMEEHCYSCFDQMTVIKGQIIK